MKNKKGEYAYRVPLSELTHIVYDTLMKNVENQQFEIDDVENQYADFNQDRIYFEYCGKAFEIRIRQTEKETVG